MMIHFVHFLSMVISWCVMCFIFAQISKKLGDALQMPPYYHLYYVSILLFFISLIFYADIMSQRPKIFNENIRQLTFFLATLISTLVTIRYWYWIFSEFKTLK